MSVNNYKCSQPDLYSGSRMVIRAAIRNIAPFTALKPKYDAVFFTNLLTNTAAAEALPDEDYRAATVTAMRIECEIKATRCLNNWQLLKGYIEDAADFQGPMQKVALEAAGSKKYAAASGIDWESVTALMASGNLFITDQTAALTADGNMPPAFGTDFAVDASKFQDALSNFQDQEELREQDTQKKIDTNNKLYDEIIQLCKDGQRIFRNDEALRAQFVWEQVLYIIHGAGIAGLRGSVTDSLTGLPIVNATITVLETGDTGITDAEGNYRITGLPAGTDTIQCKATGYVGTDVPFTILQGTISTLNFTLTV